MLTIAIVIVILVLLIVTHEFGHFIVAKLMGVRVEEFGVGYPPRAFLLGKWGGTEYTLNWIPFGGFVRLFGENIPVGTKTREPGSFFSAPKLTQVCILFAGVIANLIVAFALLTWALHIGIPRVVDGNIHGNKAHLIIADVVPGSPAEASGMGVGDQIDAVSMNGNFTTDRPKSLTPDAVTSFVRMHPGQSILFEYERAGVHKRAVMRPAQGVLKENASQPALGIALVSVSEAGLSWEESFFAAFLLAYDLCIQTFHGLGVIIASTLRGAPNLSNVVGPVGLVGAVGDASQHGAGSVLALAGFIALNLVIINLLPVPAFDGGRIAVILVELITRRRAPKVALELINLAGVVLIIVLMITVTYHDIARLIS